MRRVALLAIVVCVTAGARPAGGQTRAYTEPIEQYRRGDVEAAVASVRELSLGQVDRELDAVLRQGRRIPPTALPNLQAALLLFTDVVVADATQTDFVLTPRVGHRLATIKALHTAIKSLAPQSPFLRAWYLTWEAILQGHFFQGLKSETDYLALALEAFPQDAEVLLAAGAGHELRWWLSADNPQRKAKPDDDAVRLLRQAADMLRRSVEANPTLIEAHLRLGRVLTVLGDLDPALTELRAVEPLTEARGVRYLARLFIGDAEERRGDRAAARAAYASAMALVPEAQSARLADAYLAHAGGQRIEAAAAMERVLAAPSKDADPWWLYLRGQGWVYDYYRAAALRLVRE